MSALENTVDVEFRHALSVSLKSVRNVLDDERRIAAVAGDDESHVRHTYDDKFGLAEFLTNIALSSMNNVLERMGLEGEERNAFVDLASREHRCLTLRFQMSQTCDYVGARSVDRSIGIHDPFVTSTWEKKQGEGKDDPATDMTAAMKASGHHVIATRTVHDWNCGWQYSLSVFRGDAPEEEDARNQTFVLSRQRTSCKVVTASSGTAPSVFDPEHDNTMDLNLSWFLRQLNHNASDTQQRKGIFQVNRRSERCRTPRRNPDVAAAVNFFFDFQTWAQNVLRIFREIDDTTSQWRTALLRSGHAPSDLSLPNAISLSKVDVESTGVFIPVLPLFHCLQEGISGEAVSVSSLSSDPTNTATRTFLLTDDEVGKFLAAQCRSLDDAGTRLDKAFPAPDLQTDIITSSEAQLALLLRHGSSISACYIAGVDHIENLLRDQLAAAVGKHLQSRHFGQFVRFHCARKLFSSEYKPRPFCHSIRRPLRSPDGVVTIFDTNGSPIEVISSVSPANSETSYPRLQVSINAATTVEIGGQRHLHGWMLHRFAHEAQPRGSTEHEIAARAHQFSSIILMVGKMTGPNKFDPQDAILLQNKGEVIIPLLTEELPSPRAFRDAVASLSPEQRCFAEAYRKMQLESSVFALCIIQIKPQLEALLGLAPFSLGKEIKLTQDILQLLIEYQIPSDLLAYDGEHTGAVESGQMPTALERVNAVKGHVAAVQTMIKDVKDKQRSEEIQRTEMRLAAQLKQRGACEIYCLRGHPAEFHLTWHSSFVCDVGNHAVPHSAPMYGCRQCDWDTCERCSKSWKYRRDRQRKGELFSSLRSVRAEEPVFRSAPRIPSASAPSSHQQAQRKKPSLRQTPEPTEQVQANFDCESRLGDYTAHRVSSADASATVSSIPASLHVPLSMGTSAAAPRCREAVDSGLGTEKSQMEPKIGRANKDSGGAREKQSSVLSGSEEMMGFVERGETKESGTLDAKEDDEEAANAVDVTQLPKQLDSQLEAIGLASSVRGTILRTGESWKLTSTDCIMSEPKTTTLDSSKRRNERQRCLDLLDALSRSGSLPIQSAGVHLIVAATHSFDKSVVDTVVQDNINPIDKVEVSALLMGTVIHGFSSPTDLLQDPSDAPRISKHFPAVFPDRNTGN